MLKPSLCGCLLAAAALVPMAQSQSAASSDAPRYAADGSLVAPANYREWVFLSSGMDMSYAASKEPDHHYFDNTFVNAASYRRFLETGTWPDKTTIVLEIRGADQPVSINKRGHTQDAEVMGEEIHVKDGGTWRFYDLAQRAATATFFKPDADCYTCHREHAAVDTTFVQFYPTLLPIAKAHGTVSAAYLKSLDSSVPPASK